MAFISPHVKMCTQLTENMSPQNLFCAFLAVPHNKAYTRPLYVYIFPTKHVFLLHTFWLVVAIACCIQLKLSLC